MAFQIRCTSCQKLYAAEPRLIGKRIRCKQCGSVFTVEAPAEEPSLAASMAGIDAHHLNQSDLTGTRKAEPPPTRDVRPPDDDDTAPAPESPLLRPSIPQDFPMSQAVEAWLPLGLGLVAAVWLISQAFANNETGRSWVPLLRVAIVFLLYLGLVVPLTYKSVTMHFAKMRRLLPPSPWWRTALTFALPTAMGYVFWQASGGTGGFITGLLLGIVLMAAVYWLLFRLTPQESANGYAAAAGTYLVGCTLGALLVVGASALLNKAMVSEHAGTIFKESPLGSALAWDVSAPAPAAPAKRGAPEQPAYASSGRPPAPAPKSPDAQPGSSNLTTGPRDTSQPPPAATQAVAVATPTETVAIEPVSNPTPPPTTRERPEIFVNPDEDSFLDSIRKGNHPWVKSVTRADGQTPFDLTLSPTGPSAIIGLVKSDAAGTTRKITLGPGAGAALADVIDDQPDVQTFNTRFVLTPDGRALLHIRNNALELIATADNHRETIALESPPSSGGVMLRPSIVGVMRDANVVVRWSAPQCAEQYIYRYAYLTNLTKSKINRMKISDPNTLPDVAAVSTNATGPVFYGWLSQLPGKRPVLKMLNITATAAVQTPRVGAIPADIGDASSYERGEIAFSPDGLKVAMLLEQSGSARVLEWGTSEPVPLNLKLALAAPAQADVAGRVRGPALRWLNNLYLVVNGRTVVSLPKGGPIGDLTDQPVTGEQVASDTKLYLTYALPDGAHLAAVELDTAALRAAPLMKSDDLTSKH